MPMASISHPEFLENAKLPLNTSTFQLHTKQFCELQKFGMTDVKLLHRFKRHIKPSLNGRWRRISQIEYNFRFVSQFR